MRIRISNYVNYRPKPAIVRASIIVIDVSPSSGIIKYAVIIATISIR